VKLVFACRLNKLFQNESGSVIFLNCYRDSGFNCYFIAIILLLSSKKEETIPKTKNCTTGECAEMLNEIKKLETLITSIQSQAYLPTYPRERLSLPDPKKEIQIVPQNYARKDIPQEYTQEHNITQNYSRKDIPREYTQEHNIPQNYSRKDIPQEYTQEHNITQNYARKDIPQEYTREITQEEPIPQNYARKDTKNYPEPTSETEKTQTYSAECKDNLQYIISVYANKDNILYQITRTHRDLSIQTVQTKIIYYISLCEQR